MARPHPASDDIEAARRVLARAGYGARPGEAEAVAAAGGWRAWVHGQLAPPPGEPEVDAALAALRLRIRYPAGPHGPAVDETRPLSLIGAPQPERWALLAGGGQNGFERERVRHELAAAAILRKILARAQLRERLVEFWHDHFNVTGSNQALISLPEHDRRIRAHALGDFRALLEAVASGPAMLYYLSNQSSRAGAPNENFARELLELHTLGAGAYLGATRRWRDVPGAAEGRPEGYVDADVWEAARAFTGWTVASGQRLDSGQTLPSSGGFAYVAAWHDHHQKRVLGEEFEPYAPALADGRRVLDLVARHPATASHLCAKLARWLLGERPPQACVARAAEAFARHHGRDDQIAQAVRALFDGPEAAEPALSRARRPLDFAAAAARALEIPFAPTDRFLAEMDNSGQRLFGWPSPDGQPVEGTFYLSAAGMRHRWHFAHLIASGALETGVSPHLAALGGLAAREVAARVAGLALGPRGEAVAGTIATAWTASGRAARPAPHEVAEIAGWALASPAFQTT